jgi:hypothetical protein
MFVRQKLLAALGIEGQPLAAAQSVGPNVKRLTGELTRLHSQLKEFVAESLAPTYVTELPSPAYAVPAPEEHVPNPGEGLPGGGYEPDQDAEFDYEEAPVTPSPGPSVGEPRVFVESEDKLEQFARRAFAISPRLGAIELPGDSAPAQNTAPARKSRDPLDELLEDSSASQDSERANAYREAASGFDDSADEDDDEDEDAVFDVPLSLSNRAERSQTEQKPQEPPPAPIPPPQPPSPPSGPIDLSGGPPPKRRQ